jgi:acylphosphatase
VTGADPLHGSIRCLIDGRVQRVFYRAATAEQATRLALRGWARNLADGRVEVVATGPLPALEQLTAWLWEGPRAARVDSVQIEPWDEELPAGFTVA